MHRPAILAGLLLLPTTASIAVLGRTVSTVPARAAGAADIRELEDTSTQVDNARAREAIVKRREAPIRDKIGDQIEELAGLGRRLRMALEYAESDLARSRNQVRVEAEAFLSACINYDVEQETYETMRNWAAGAPSGSGSPPDIPSPPSLTQIIGPGNRFASVYRNARTESERAGLDARDKLEGLRSQLLGVFTALSDLELELLDNASARLDLERELQQILSSIGSYARGTALPPTDLPRVDLDGNGIRVTMRGVAESVAAALTDRNVTEAGARMLDGDERIALAVREFNRRLAR